MLHIFLLKAAKRGGKEESASGSVVLCSAGALTHPHLTPTYQAAVDPDANKSAASRLRAMISGGVKKTAGATVGLAEGMHCVCFKHG